MDFYKDLNKSIGIFFTFGKRINKNNKKKIEKDRSIR